MEKPVTSYRAVDLQARLQSILRTLKHSGFDARPLTFERPASETELAAAERQLGCEIPSSFRRVLAFVSGHVEFCWFAPKGLRFPEPFDQNFSGELHWSLPRLVQYAHDKQQWIEKVFKSPNDPYDRVWHGKLAFHEVGNGDYLAIDLATSTQGQIVYLSHDDGDGHGHVLAPSFVELLERWVPLGCAGAEDWQWLPFTDNGSQPIDPACQHALIWRELLRIDT